MVFYLIAYAFTFCIVGSAIFGPLFRYTAVSDPSRKIYITDVAGLLVNFQIGFASLNFWLPGIKWNTSIAGWTIAWILIFSGLPWFYGLRFLWKAGVEHRWKRLVVLCLVMPLGVVTTVAGILVVVSMSTVFDGILRMAALIAIVFVLRHLGQWCMGLESPSRHVQDDQDLDWSNSNIAENPVPLKREF